MTRAMVATAPPSPASRAPPATRVDLGVRFLVLLVEHPAFERAPQRMRGLGPPEHHVDLRLLPADVVRQLPPGHGLLALEPVHVELVPERSAELRQRQPVAVVVARWGGS